MKKIISTISTAFLIVCAIIVTIMVIRREFYSPNNQQDTTIENWQDIEFTDLPTETSSLESGSIQLIKFYDYECPYCKKVQPAIRSILSKYSNSISTYYAHLPLSSHSYAYKAAIAAECARKQNTFSVYDSLLFERQDQLGAFSYTDLAKKSGIEEISLFSNCLESNETQNVVEKGIKLAQKINVTSIPTFVINGRIISGAVPEETLIAIIEEELRVANE